MLNKRLWEELEDEIEKTKKEIEEKGFITCSKCKGKKEIQDKMGFDMIRIIPCPMCSGAGKITWTDIVRGKIQFWTKESFELHRLFED